MADVMEEIYNNFPTWAWLFEDPEIGPLLRDAVDPNIGFSPNTFQAKVMGTNWWRTRSAAARNYELLSHTDPGELQSQRDMLAATFRQRSRMLGVPMNEDEIRFAVEAGVMEGWSPDDPRIESALGSLMLQGGKTATGAIETLTQQITATARKKYFLAGMADAPAWAVHIATGSHTFDDVEREMQQLSMSLYPHLRKELEAGATMQDIFSGHISLIADEMELSPDQVDLTSGHWAKVLDTWDTNASQHRPLTLSETRSLAREQPNWWGTARGKSMEAGLSNYILSAFGKRR